MNRININRTDSIETPLSRAEQEALKGAIKRAYPANTQYARQQRKNTFFQMATDADRAAGFIARVNKATS